MNQQKPKPDDSEWNELLQDSESIQEALMTVADKYGADVTNNEPRWQNGVYLRHLGDFIQDVLEAVNRFPDEAIAKRYRSDLPKS